MVLKADGTWRQCGDYRALNAQAVPNRYPLPYLQDFTMSLHGKAVFSKIDLDKAYHQVAIYPDDIPKTAITIPFGLFEFTRMSFGLRKATQTFQRLIHDVPRGLDCVFPYVDDIIVASSSPAEHEEHLRQLFQRLKSANLRINLGKSELFRETITFLGHEVTPQGIRSLPKRVKAIKEFPLSKTVTELNRFLCLCCVILPNSRTFPMVDASDFATGAALHQIVDQQLQPLGFFSKRFNPAQTRYSTYDR